MRLFNRTTRALHATEHGRLFYDGARSILESISEAEGTVMEAAKNPRGTLFVAAPLGLGRRIIAPAIPLFQDRFPEIDIRLRLSDRLVDVTAEGLDLAFHLGQLVDSDLKVRGISECERVLVASPGYIEKRGCPADGEALIRDRHACLNLRFPGAQEFQWTLETPDGPKRYEIFGPLESDDVVVLTDWSVSGHGIILKPRFEIAHHLASGALVPVATATPPYPVQLACLSPSRRLRDPKVQIFTEFMVQYCKDALRNAEQV